MVILVDAAEGQLTPDSGYTIDNTLTDYRTVKWIIYLHTTIIDKRHNNVRI